MRHCHIVLLHAAAAAVLLCMVLSALGKSSSQLSVQQGVGVHFGRDRGLKGHHTPVMWQMCTKGVKSGCTP